MPKDIIEKTAIKICANVYEEACRLGIPQYDETIFKRNPIMH